MSIEAQAQPKRRSSGKRVVVYLILILIIAAFAGGYFLGSGDLAILASNQLEPKNFVRIQRDHVLRPDDLRIDYQFESAGDSPWTNGEIIQVMGQNDGKRFISETGRVDGWQSGLAKVTTSDLGPETYTSRIQVFETEDGADQALKSKWFWGYTAKEENYDNFEEDTCSIGNDCITVFYDLYYQESGLIKVRYDVAFRYENIVVWISANGLDVDTSMDDVLGAAQILYNKLAELK